MIQQKVAKVRGVADIVFCIDFSGSMSPCIEGVKEHISTFVKSLETTSANVTIDWRIGFCAYTDDNFLYKSFCTDTNDFSSSLGNVDISGDEFTSGAIDFCITQFDWRPVSNRFLIVFTDEDLMGGYAPPEVQERFPLLLKKIEDSKTRLFFFGPKCKYYGQFETVQRSKVQYLEDQSFASIDFSVLLSMLGKTVSQSCNQQVQSPLKKADYVFDLSHVKIQQL